MDVTTGEQTVEREPPIARVLKSKFLGGGLVTAVVRRFRNR
jgi:hypothetical protein